MRDRQAFEHLIEEITSCARYAEEVQKSIRRTYKDDGSVLTKTDLEINSRISSAIRRLFPSAGIISEEEDSISHKEGADYIFCLDPIDGTDSYSQGFPSWCIAVGILDARLNPIGGIVSAPRFGPGTSDDLLIFRLPGENIVLQGEQITEFPEFKPKDGLIVSSKVFKHIDLSSFGGKVRGFGSTILHLLSPILFSHVQAALIPSCFIWDVAAAHGIIAAAGLEIRYLDGKPMDYEQIADRSPTSGYALAATAEVYERVRSQITERR